MQIDSAEPEHKQGNPSLGGLPQHGIPTNKNAKIVDTATRATSFRLFHHRQPKEH